MWFVRYLSAALIAALCATPLGAWEAPLQMDQAFKLKVERDPSGIAFRWEIAPGYYLYRDHLTARDGQDRPVTLDTSKGTVKDDPGFGSIEVYYGSASVIVPSNPTKVSITYQGCQDGGLCYPPTTKSIDTSTLAITETNPLQIAGSAQTTDWTEAAVTDSLVKEESGFQLDPATSDTPVHRLMSQGGLPLLILGFLSFGLLLAFTPCVFPMYPIVAAMLSRERGSMSPGRGLLLSATYVLALASAFGILGMAAAWSGQNLHMALQSPYAVGAIAMLFVVLAISNFGVFELQLPSAIRNDLANHQSSGASVTSAAVLGFSSALLIGPCVTAPLAGALIYIGQSGRVLVGALALFALGLGKGIPLIAMATFGSRIMPRAGAWMEAVRRGFGFLFLATAIYVATPLIDASYIVLLWGLLCLALGAYASTIETSRDSARAAGRSIALASIIWGALLLIGFAAGGTDPMRPLATFQLATGTEKAEPIGKDDFAKVASTEELADLLDSARADDRATVLYVTADWCVTCRSIERNLLPNHQVASELKSARLLMLDVSSLDSDRQALMKSLSVIGPPTMLFFAKGRKEVAGTRLVGDFSAANLLDAALRTKEIVH